MVRRVFSLATISAVVLLIFAAGCGEEDDPGEGPQLPSNTTNNDENNNDDPNNDNNDPDPDPEPPEIEIVAPDDPHYTGDDVLTVHYSVVEGEYDELALVLRGDDVEQVFELDGGDELHDDVTDAHLEVLRDEPADADDEESNQNDEFHPGDEYEDADSYTFLLEAYDDGDFEVHLEATWEDDIYESDRLTVHLWREPLQIESVDPADEARYFDPNRPLQFTFDQHVDAETLGDPDAVSVSSSGGDPIEFDAESDGKLGEIHLEDDGLEVGDEIEVELTGQVADLAGNALYEPAGYTFRVDIAHQLGADIGADPSAAIETGIQRDPDLEAAIDPQGRVVAAWSEVQFEPDGLLSHIHAARFEQGEWNSLDSPLNPSAEDDPDDSQAAPFVALQFDDNGEPIVGFHDDTGNFETPQLRHFPADSWQLFASLPGQYIRKKTAVDAVHRTDDEVYLGWTDQQLNAQQDGSVPLDTTIMHWNGQRWSDLEFPQQQFHDSTHLETMHHDGDNLRVAVTRCPVDQTNCPDGDDLGIWQFDGDEWTEIPRPEGLGTTPISDVELLMDDSELILGYTTIFQLNILRLDDGEWTELAVEGLDFSEDNRVSLLNHGDQLYAGISLTAEIHIGPVDEDDGFAPEWTFDETETPEDRFHPASGTLISDGETLYGLVGTEYRVYVVRLL